MWKTTNATKHNKPVTVNITIICILVRRSCLPIHAGTTFCRSLQSMPSRSTFFPVSSFTAIHIPTQG